MPIIVGAHLVKNPFVFSLDPRLSPQKPQWGRHFWLSVICILSCKWPLGPIICSALDLKSGTGTAFRLPVSPSLVIPPLRPSRFAPAPSCPRPRPESRPRSSPASRRIYGACPREIAMEGRLRWWQLAGGRWGKPTGHPADPTGSAPPADGLRGTCAARGRCAPRQLPAAPGLYAGREVPKACVPPPGGLDRLLARTALHLERAEWSISAVRWRHI